MVFLSSLEIIHETLRVECRIDHLILEMKYACTFYNVSILNIFIFLLKIFSME